MVVIKATVLKKVSDSVIAGRETESLISTALSEVVYNGPGKTKHRLISVSLQLQAA